MPGIMISCGEASGDLYAGALAAEIRTLSPETPLFGFGGAALRAAGADLIGDYRGLAVTGLSEALAVLPRSFRMYRRLVAAARISQPAALVAIDFPDFNFRLASAVHALGVPVVYYVSPQIWAWRRGRVRAMRRFARRVLVIFPFETAFYEEAGVPVEFVGHPLIELARAPESREAFLARIGLPPAGPVVALLPGSRPNEIKAILPGLLQAARLVAQRVSGVRFLLARAPNLDQELFRAAARDACAPLVLEGATDQVLACADATVTASGTATVQAAIHGCPMVIVYRLSPLTYRLGRPFVHVESYGMVNLVAGRRIVPELIQDAFTPERVADETIRLLIDRPYADSVRVALGDVRASLGGAGASRRAAEAVLAVARHG